MPVTNSFPKKIKIFLKCFGASIVYIFKEEYN